MPWLIALMLTIGVMTGAGTAWAVVYVPGHLRDGVYTRPHFLDAPEARYDRPVRMEGEQTTPPKPTIIDEMLPPEKPPPAPAPADLRS